MTEQETPSVWTEEPREEEPELVPSKLSVTHILEQTGRWLLACVVGLGRRIASFGSFLLRLIFSLVRFLRNPGQSIIRFVRRMRNSSEQMMREMDSLSWIQLIGIIIIFGLFLIAPLLSVVWGSFMTEDGFSLDIVLSLFRNPAYIPQWRPIDFRILRPSPLTGIVEVWGMDLGVIVNSLYMAAFVTFISVLLGTSFAFLIARYEFPGKGVLRTLLLFPMLSTPFIGAIGIKWFMGGNGFLNNLAAAFVEGLGSLFSMDLSWTRIEFHGIAAIIVVQGLSLFSLVYLNAYSSFMGIDPSLEEQAENLGATGFKLFRSVTLPLAMPGIQAGAILTFILSIEDLGTPIVYSEDYQAQNVLAYQVFNSITAESGGINPIGPAIGMILLVFAFAGFLAIRKYAALRSYASASKGGQWNPRTRRLRRHTWILMYIIVIPVLFFALIPQISVIYLSFAQYRSSALFPPLTLNNFALLGDGNIQGALVRTISYAGVATFGTVLLGVSAAYLISRRNIPGRTALDLLVTSPIALPGIVIATGYFTLFYNTPIFPQDFPMFLIIMSFLVRKFPFTVRAAYAGLQQTPVALEEAAQNVGASKNKTFTSIVMPLIGVSVLAGALLSFVYSVSEVSTSLLLGGANYYQAPLTYWVREVNAALPPLYGAGPAAALGVLMMAMQMIVIAVTNAILKTRASAMTGI